MSIEVSRISKVYGQQKALDEVSFSIAKGEVVGLLGPNGAGKSTMMKILTCFIPPSAGTAKVCGIDVMASSIEVRNKVGYLPEHNPLYVDMYVREYLNFVAGIHKLGKSTKERVDQMIELTGLTLESKKKIRALSKGYRQRVGLAQALIHEPEVLILDEPTSGLDPNQLVDIRNLIRNIGKERTVMLSTHIMQEVEAVCDRVIIIDRGKIVKDEKTSSIHTEQSGKLVITVEFGEAVSEEALLNIEHIEKAHQIEKNSWRLISPAENDPRQNIFTFAVDTNNAVLSLSKEEVSLEEVFQKLTKK